MALSFFALFLFEILKYDFLQIKSKFKQEILKNRSVGISRVDLEQALVLK